MAWPSWSGIGLILVAAGAREMRAALLAERRAAGLRGVIECCFEGGGLRAEGTQFGAVTGAPLAVGALPFRIGLGHPPSIHGSNVTAVLA